MSYSCERKVIEYRQTDRCHTILNCPDLSESLNPVKAISEIEKRMVVPR